jgi:glucose-1-phosphate adenylyltransferase
MLFTRVRVHSFAVVEDSVLLPKVEVGRNCVIRRAVIDRGCSIPEGTRIGVDPDADRARFRVSENGVVLVTRAMLGQDIPRVR